MVYTNYIIFMLNTKKKHPFNYILDYLRSIEIYKTTDNFYLTNEFLIIFCTIPSSSLFSDKRQKFHKRSFIELFKIDLIIQEI